MNDVVAFFIIAWLGFLVGFLFRSWLQTHYNAHYHGTIYVTKSPDKTVYSLELEDFPESLEKKKRVVLKVDASGRSFDRE